MSYLVQCKKLGLQNKHHCITLKIKHTNLSGLHLISSVRCILQENYPIIKTREKLTRTSQHLTEH